MIGNDSDFSEENAHCFACEHSDACMRWEGFRMVIACAAKNGNEQAELEGESCKLFSETELPE